MGFPFVWRRTRLRAVPHENATCSHRPTVPVGKGFCPTKSTGEYTLQVTAGRFWLLWVTLQGFDSPRLHLFCLDTAGDFLKLFPKTVEVFPSSAQIQGNPFTFGVTFVGRLR